MGWKAKSDLIIQGVQQPLSFAYGSGEFVGIRESGDRSGLRVSCNAAIAGILYKNGMLLIIASDSVQTYHAEMFHNDNIISEGDATLNNSYTYNGKTVYYATQSGAGGEYAESDKYNRYVSPYTWDAGNGSTYSGEIAWTIVYGDVEYDDSVNIPVQWLRSDGETLEDTFTIKIGETEGVEEPVQQDPFVGYADIAWNGHFYNINKRKVPTIHYANGTVWQEGISTEYSIEQAASLGLIILIR